MTNQNKRVFKYYFLPRKFYFPKNYSRTQKLTICEKLVRDKGIKIAIHNVQNDSSF